MSGGHQGEDKPKSINQLIDSNKKYVDSPGGSDGKEFTCNTGDLVQSLGGEDPLEKEMATHSSILAWRIPRTQEPGRLQSMGS